VIKSLQVKTLARETSRGPVLLHEPPERLHLLGMLIEHGHPCLTSGIRDLEDHDVSEGCRETIRFGTK